MLQLTRRNSPGYGLPEPWQRRKFNGKCVYVIVNELGHAQTVDQLGLVCEVSERNLTPFWYRPDLSEKMYSTFPHKLTRFDMDAYHDARRTIEDELKYLRGGE